MSVRLGSSSRFKIIRQLGVGGFGVVYEALDGERQARVALKSLNQLDAASLFRFKQEFRVFADLHHDNLVKLHELVSEGDQWFFTMELITGVDWYTHVTSTDALYLGGGLSSRDDLTMEAQDVTAPQGTGSGLPVAVIFTPEPAPATSSANLERVRATLIQVVRGLETLHQAGSCHRDVKPSNILVTPGGRAVLLDFGIATTEVNGQKQTEVNAILGTPAYMAPEQVVSSLVTPAADWYAIGVMLYEALTGMLPFSGHPVHILSLKQTEVPVRPAQRAPQTPPDLDRLCMDLLRISPTERPGAGEILAALGATPTGAVSGTRGRTTGGNQPFVGREDLLEQLGQAYESSRQGALNLVFLQGSSGMGKSTLMRTFLGRVPGEPLVLQGRCLQRESVPYKAFDQAIDGLSRSLLGLSREEAARLMPRDAAALARVFPVLDRVPAIAGSPRKAADLQDPYLVRSRAFGALRELLGRISDRRPVVVFLDDVQWGDADSASLLSELLAPPEPPPVLFVLCFRTEEASASVLLTALERRLEVIGLAGREHRLSLGTLSTEQAVALARRLLGAEDERRAEAVARESAGSPFFLGELVQYAQTEEGKSGRGEIRLDDVIQRRLDQLSEVSRSILRLVSVSGSSLDRQALRLAGEFDEDTLASSVRVLRVANLVRLSGFRGEKVEPFHDKIREAVVEGLSAPVRVELHRNLALALNAMDATDPETLLVHFRAGGLLERARLLARVAAERSSSALAFDRAAELWQEALDLGGWGQAEERSIQLSRAEALSRAGRGAPAAAAFLSLAQGQEPLAALELHRRAGEELLLAGEVDQGTAVMNRVLAAVNIRPPSTLVGLLASIAMMTLWIRLRGWGYVAQDESRVSALDRLRLEVCLSCGKAFSSFEILYGLYFARLGACYAMRSPSHVFVAMALVGYAGHLAASDSRRLDEALGLIERAVSLVAGDPRESELRRIAALAAGLGLAIAGRWEASAGRLDEVLGPLRRGGGTIQWDLDTAMHSSIINWARLGRLTEVASRMPLYLRDALNRGDLYLSTMLRVGAGSVLWLVRDAPEEGRADVEAALERWSRASLDLARWWGQYSLFSLDLYQAKNDAAFERAQRLLAEMRWSRVRALQTLWSLSHVLVAQGAIARLEGFVGERAREQAVAALVRAAVPRTLDCFLPILQLSRAGLEWLHERREASLALVAQAHDGAVRYGMEQYVACCQIRRGQLTGGDDGAALVAHGVEWMRARGVVNPARFLRAHSPGFPPPGGVPGG